MVNLQLTQKQLAVVLKSLVLAKDFSFAMSIPEAEELFHNTGYELIQQLERKPQ